MLVSDAIIPFCHGCALLSLDATPVVQLQASGDLTVMPAT
jgi:hypothetical protein